MDDLLQPYLHATTESERQRNLGELLLVHTAPVITRTLRQRLGFHLSQAETTRNNQDAEDLYQEIMTNLVETLYDLRTAATKIEIENFRQYVARAAINACNDFLRAKSPTQSRLKHNVRDILSRHRDFALWEDQGELIGGLAIWQGTSQLPASDRQVRDLQNDLDTFRRNRFSNQDLQQIPITRIVAELLQWVGRPIRVDTLTTTVSLFLGVKEYPNELPYEDKTAVIEAHEGALRADSDLGAGELLSQLWEVVRILPKTQRDIFCLSFEDDSGADLFSLLLEARIVRLPQLAQALDRSTEQLVRLRSRMPMDIATLTVELNLTRSQVTQRRFRAIRRVREELLAWVSR